MASESESDHEKSERARINIDTVVDAIKALKEVNGCTITAVKKYIVSNASDALDYRDATRQIQQALKRGMKDGQISKVNRYKYAVMSGLDEDDEGSKKKRRRRIIDDEDGMRPNRMRRSRRRRRSRKRRGGRGRRRSRRRRGRGRRRSRRRGGRRGGRRRRRSRRRRSRRRRRR